jgi:hypothetical protein
MDSFVWPVVMIVILAVAVALVGIMVWKFKTGRLRRSEPDYKTFFSIGLVWTMFGAVFMLFDSSMTFFLPMGVVFLALGLANRDKWGKKPPLCTSTRKKIMLATLTGVIALVIGMVLVAMLIG